MDSKMTTHRSNSIDLIQGLQDIEPPFGVPLSGMYIRSFAFATIKDRLPVILTRVIDTLSRDKDQIVQKYQQESVKELKEMIGFISKLKNEITTNKPLQPLLLLPDKTNSSAHIWNKYLEERTEIEGKTPTWFNTIWIYCESYMYRTLAQTFAFTKTLREYDPFAKQKQDGFTTSLISISTLARYTVDLIDRSQQLSSTERKQEFIKLIQLNLWGNRCDLSLSGGAEASQVGDPIELLKDLRKNIIVDETESIWNLLNETKKRSNEVIVDIVLDNSGYEFVTDLCLATFFIDHGLAQKIRFYVKLVPWYVSDVTINDFHWVIDSMRTSSIPELIALSEVCTKHLNDNVWTIEEESYWTEPYDFCQMKNRNPTLYSKLSNANLIVFKGDLNYRKLVGDINWEYTTNFARALRGFLPSNIASLRTVKSDVCVGLPSGKAQVLREKDEDWMITGQYGLIQTTIDTGCSCNNTKR